MENDIIHTLFLVFAGLFTFLCCIISGSHIINHLTNYNKPSHQKLIIRILLISPIYAVDSWLSLYTKRYYWGLFIIIARDCYEAYVLYSFFKLLCCYLGGEEAIIALLQRKERHYILFPLCCISFLPGKRFYIICLQFILQYAIIKPINAIIAAILFVFDKYEDANFALDEGYIYTTIINNISVFLALYFLVNFYEVFKEELSAHRPVLKFLIIKGILFFIFWQSVFIHIFIWFDLMPSAERYSSAQIGYFVNDFLVCFEMFLASIAQAIAFTHYDYLLTSCSKDNLITSNSKGGFVSFVKDVGYNIKRYKSDLVSGVVDVHKDKDIVLDTIKSVKHSRSKSRRNKYHNFVDLTTPNESLDPNDYADEDEDNLDNLKININHNNNNSLLEPLDEDNNNNSSFFKIQPISNNNGANINDNITINDESNGAILFTNNQ
ncbi:transmembrane protein [Tieghemostelium lacteum]|uniref:Transmembrane protein n=1 Tax=Tieghemostelium lacteum TaxID=361077 RepID=A0A151ZBK1_TIELA|nr:transmembrane protein [Tieghemostelium lacteum]|eukprot:KYQ91305.1 transmembrane protein [Tieghemostelium lacteum]